MNEYELYDKYNGTVTVSELSKTDLKNLIQTGESSFLEFKRKITSPERIAREMAAFANTKGGTILIGVDDNGDLIGLESYLEEEFLLNQAAEDLCKPKLELAVELLHVGKRDVLIVHVAEAKNKPVFVASDSRRKVYIRQQDENVEASEQRREVMKNRSSDRGVTFEYGPNQRALFRFLNEYGDVTVKRFATLIGVTTYRASTILVDLVSVGVLSMFEKDGIEHYTFSHKNA